MARTQTSRHRAGNPYIGHGCFSLFQSEPRREKVYDYAR